MDELKENQKLKEDIKEFSQKADFLNIFCLGRSGSGKSALIKKIVDERFKIKTAKGLPQTKGLLLYPIKGLPLQIFDSEGIEDKMITENTDFIKAFLKKDSYKKLSQNVEMKGKSIVHVLWIFLDATVGRVLSFYKDIIEFYKEFYVFLLITKSDLVPPSDLKLMVDEINELGLSEKNDNFMGVYCVSKKNNWRVKTPRITCEKCSSFFVNDQKLFEKQILKCENCKVDVSFCNKCKVEDSDVQFSRKKNVWICETCSDTQLPIFMVSQLPILLQKTERLLKNVNEKISIFYKKKYEEIYEEAKDLKKKIEKKDEIKGTVKGGAIGGTIGAVGGSTLGAVTGGIMAGIPTLGIGIIPGMIIGGLGGGMIGGYHGGVVGATTGNIVSKEREIFIDQKDLKLKEDKKKKRKKKLKKFAALSGGFLLAGLPGMMIAHVLTEDGKKKKKPALPPPPETKKSSKPLPPTPKSVEEDKKDKKE